MDASNVITAGSSVLCKADESLVNLLNNMGGGAGTTGAGDVHVGMDSMKVGEIAKQNQEISNTISAASQCISTGKQNDQKVTGAQTR